jgi:hypothetical protein
MNRDPLDDRLDALLRDARRTYNPPPDLPDVDAMWSAIDDALPTAAAPALTVVPGSAPRRTAVWNRPWFRMAAVLVVGVAVGRASVGRAPSAAPDATVAEAVTERNVATPGDADRALADEYLGRTNALLAALPAELESRRTDPAYLARAEALLLQTRLLLDSPAATDPALRALFDDLEIVLAQVVRLRSDRDPTRIDFLEQALEQRDVLPRLRDAVADADAD